MTSHRKFFRACAWFCAVIAGSIYSAAADVAPDRLQVKSVLAKLWAERQAQLVVEREPEMTARVVRAAGREMKFTETKFGDRPAGERSLWISLHGGGSAPAAVNDQQWRNQSRLYKLEEGYYVAPRAPTDTWNMWHEDHMDALIDRLIENYVATRGVNPNRVYLLGYSAGGDGVYQLAPRMADRFAAAAMMAGHPNNASPLGLRNLPFAILVGGRDAAYDRNRIAGEWAAKLAELARADDGGRGGVYEKFVRIFPDKAHWMDREDAVAIPWMASKVRNAWPRRVVWEQGNRTGFRFYWLALPANEKVKSGALMRADVNGQTITLTTADYATVTLRLSDALVDLDQPVTIVANGRVVFSGKVGRSAVALAESLRERADPTCAAAALVEVRL